MVLGKLVTGFPKFLPIKIVAPITSDITFNFKDLLFGLYCKGQMYTLPRSSNLRHMS